MYIYIHMYNVYAPGTARPSARGPRPKGAGDIV